MPTESPRQVADWLKPDDIGIMLDTAKTLYREQYELLCVLAFTGMRLGEVLALEWGDIDMRGHNIRVRRSRSRWGVHRPKTGRERVVDIGADLVATLRKLYARRAEQTLAAGRGAVLETVFLNQHGAPVSPQYVRESFTRVLKRAGLRRVRLHDLRHSYASNLLQAGAPIQFVSRQLGHASIKMTVDVYGHLLPGGYSDVLNQYHNAVHTRESATHPQPVPNSNPA
jgi:integrase